MFKKIILSVTTIFLSLLCMQENPYNQLKIKDELKDLVPLIAMNLTVAEIAGLKRVCNEYNTLCSIDSIIEKSSFTGQALADNFKTCSNALVHYAQIKNEKLFQHIWNMQNKNDNEKRIAMVKGVFKQNITPKDCMRFFRGKFENSFVKKKRLQLLRNTMLYAKALKGEYEEARILLANNADPNLFSDQSDPLLHTVIERGFVDLVQLLVEYGIHVNKESELYPYAVPLRYAVKTGCVKTMKILLNAGAEVDKVDLVGETSLHLACREGSHYKVVACLLDHGANIEARTSNYKTPLRIACENKHFFIARQLLARGACVESNANLRFGLYCNGNTEAVQVLESYGVGPCFKKKSIEKIKKKLYVMNYFMLSIAMIIELIQIL